MLQLDARGDLDDLVSGKLAGSLLHASPERMLEAGDLVATTRLQIPLLMADDCIHGHSFWPGATIFPTQLGDGLHLGPRPRRARRSGHGRRGRRDRPALDLLAGAVHRPRPALGPRRRDVRRRPAPDRRARRRDDPRLPGRRPRRPAPPSSPRAKHFAGYSETQGGRDASEADLSRRKLRSWFLPPFQRAVRGRLPHLHARLPSHRRRPHHGQQLAAQRRPQGRVGLHRHPGHRLGQRRPDGLGAEGLRHRRRGGVLAVEAGQRLRHDHARSSSRPPRRPSPAAAARRAPHRRRRAPHPDA